ncbi:MAG TPA: EamA family transporter [Syntrophorhabdales bacterium]|nr:EamA family transporter [Syntrophorhabdales bacterium]
MDERLSRKGLFSLCVVYVVWSTTYLAMRIGVAPGNGFPPFALGMVRMAAAAFILLAMARVQGMRIKPTRSELVSLAVAGNLLWCGGNGLVLWAEQYAASGFSCLMVSSAPIWATIVELLLYRKRPSAALTASLLIGFAGVAILSAPSLSNRSSTDVSVIGALILSPLCWVLGSIFQARRPVNLTAQVMSGYHHLTAFFGFLAASLALGEPMPHPSVSAWMAWGYLVVFASVGAFTAYVFALRSLPFNIVMTYAYINPVLALFLGWLLMNEPVTLRTLCGAGLVVLSVFAIFHTRQQTKITPHHISVAESIPADEA